MFVFFNLIFVCFKLGGVIEFPFPGRNRYRDIEWPLHFKVETITSLGKVDDGYGSGSVRGKAPVYPASPSASVFAHGGKGKWTVQWFAFVVITWFQTDYSTKQGARKHVETAKDVGRVEQQRMSWEQSPQVRLGCPQARARGKEEGGGEKSG